MKNFNYTAQVVLSVGNMDRDLNRSFRTKMESHLTERVSDMSIDLIHPVVLKEQDLPIVNDRLILNVIFMFSESMDLRLNSLKNVIGEELKMVAEDIGMVLTIKSITISKL